MGTRSTTLFVEKGTDSKTGKTKLTKCVKLYRQMDGYPEGHGLEIAEFLASGKLVNGISLGSEQLQFNGIGCLAAAAIKELKNGPGGIYVTPLSAGPEQYNYTITVLSPWYKNTDNSPSIEITCREDRKVHFKGTPQEFIAKYKK